MQTKTNPRDADIGKSYKKKIHLSLSKPFRSDPNKVLRDLPNLLVKLTKLLTAEMSFTFFGSRGTLDYWMLCRA